MDKIRVVLQARLNSARLPGKSLLPVGGVPLAILAALRAGNTGLDVLLATSDAVSDDELALTAEQYGVEVFRGALENVYQRFVDATSDLAEKDWVVRLTADNVFPDGAFITELVEMAEARKVEYMGTPASKTKLPYGMSAEVFTAHALRHVPENLTAHDREHVTPAIIRKYGFHPAAFSERRDFSYLRCTVDTFKDYLRLSQLFSHSSVGKETPWFELVETLAETEVGSGDKVPKKALQERSLGVLTLGTAQLGLESYGRANATGRPTAEFAHKIVHFAISRGVTHIDCAQAYGLAEARIGRALREGSDGQPQVVTKLSPLSFLDALADQSTIRSCVDASIFESCHRLQVRTLDIVMLHRWSHHSSHKGQIWQRLLELQAEGIIRELGASVSTPVEATEALSDLKVKHLQIPFHLADKRWEDESYSRGRQNREDVIVYGRSTFLQGVLLSAPNVWPSLEGYNAHEMCQILDELVEEFDRESRADLCLAYVLGSKLLDTAVVGTESLEQLQENIRLAQNTPLSQLESEKVRQRIPSLPTNFLDPSKWPQKE